MSVYGADPLIHEQKEAEKPVSESLLSTLKQATSTYLFQYFDHGGCHLAINLFLSLDIAQWESPGVPRVIVTNEPNHDYNIVT